jgi:hypothetical protein
VAQAATVVARDPSTGRYYEVQVIVLKRVELSLDCSCWRHATRDHALEMILTAGGVYFRPLGTNEHYREAGHVGPIAIVVTTQTQMER